MSVFGSSISAICSDYFGDEFGLPLPRIKRTTINDDKPEAAGFSNSTKLQEPMNKTSSNTSPKSLQGTPPHVALAFAPNLDGLGFYETLVLR
ncbi:hypothetical protein Pint_14797 [Pistacia integerrima]|uniref:Uncharacterized protein n=1 Tax=Pistacia integerrima TaxID=434235 RepID=A0ACC0ZDH0_9ROSI|nr:hypothetical protein Pint_14797 [Pistacia integerrima]